MLLAFSATVYLYMGSGFFWPDNNIDAACQETWWWNLLYINNFQSQEKMVILFCTSVTLIKFPNTRITFSSAKAIRNNKIIKKNICKFLENWANMQPQVGFFLI